MGRPRRATAFLAAVVVVAASACTGSDGGDGDPPAAATGTDDTEGTGVISGADTAVVRRESLSSRLELDATTVLLETRIAGGDGAAVEVLVPDGEQVAEGEPVVRVAGDRSAVTEATRRVEDATLSLREARLGDLSDPSQRLAVQRAELELQRARADSKVLRDTDQTIDAPFAGVVDVRPDGSVHIEAGLVVEATVDPLQALRLDSGERVGSVALETITGPRSVRCTSVDLVSRPGGESGDAETTVARCTPMSTVDSVAGLPTTLSVTVDLGTNVLVLPDAAISYGPDGASTVELVTEGSTETVPVELGPSDGVLRVVEGLDEGATVMVE